jgi:quercetin dioxygenase-like cupin family protein
MTPVLLALLAILCAGSSLAASQPALRGTPQTIALPPGIFRTELLDNETVLVARLRMAPGAREEVHTHPFSAVVLQLTAGEVDMQLGDTRGTSRREHGFVEFIPRLVPHAAVNVGSQPYDVVTIALKPERRPGGDAPPTPAPAGITRTPVLDNAEARVARVGFAPSAREPVHSHPFDLVVVQLTPGRVEVKVGEQVTTKDHAAGEAIFFPRDVPHAVSNVGATPFDALSVGIK